MSMFPESLPFASFNLLDFDEANFDPKFVVAWTREHTEVPVIAVSLYLLFVFQVPGYLKLPLQCKTLFALWNLFLSLFSIGGCVKTVPHLYAVVRTHGFLYTVCEDPQKWYWTGPCSYWVILFIYSKTPELIDTVFSVVRKEKVIFLQWYHHVTVMLYCWHALHTLAAPGLWFVAMSYSVHSCMYFYFFMVNIGFYKAMQPFAPFITTIQIMQMVGGIICLGTVAYTQFYLGDYDRCNVNGANVKMGFCMYASYFVLFAILFYNKYCKVDDKKKLHAGPPREDLLLELSKVELRKRVIEGLLARPIGDEKAAVEGNGIKKHK